MAPEIFQHTRALELLRAGSGNADAQFRQGQLEAIQSVCALGSRLLRDAGGGPKLLISFQLALMGNQIAVAERMGLVVFLKTTTQQPQPFHLPVVMGFPGVLCQEPAG